MGSAGFVIGYKMQSENKTLLDAFNDVHGISTRYYTFHCEIHRTQTFWSISIGLSIL